MRRMLGMVAAAAAVVGAGLPVAAWGQDRAVVQVAAGRFRTSAHGAAGPGHPTARGDPSVFRLHLGPVAATTGRGLGPGLGVAADFGSGTLGFRLAAAWAHGEPSTASPSPLGAASRSTLGSSPSTSPSGDPCTRSWGSASATRGSTAGRLRGGWA